MKLRGTTNILYTTSQEINVFQIFLNKRDTIEIYESLQVSTTYKCVCWELNKSIQQVNK